MINNIKTIKRQPDNWFVNGRYILNDDGTINDLMEKRVPAGIKEFQEVLQLVAKIITKKLKYD